MAKKDDLPAFPFYFGDWRKAPEVRAMDLDVRMIWFEMLGFMWESTERGYLTLNGKPIDDFVISKLIGIEINVIKNAIEQMETLGVFSRRSDGAIFCRRMVKDEEIRKLRSDSGTKGMEVRYNKSDNTPYNKSDNKSLTRAEDENEKEKRKGGVGEKQSSMFSFEKFWDLYDKKVDRKSTERKYAKVSESNRQKIFDHVPRYKISTPDPKFRKNPDTYLNNECWNDNVVSSSPVVMLVR